MWYWSIGALEQAFVPYQVLPSLRIDYRNGILTNLYKTFIYDAFR